MKKLSWTTKGGIIMASVVIAAILITKVFFPNAKAGLVDCPIDRGPIEMVESSLKYETNGNIRVSTYVMRYYCLKCGRYSFDTNITEKPIK